MRVFKFGGASVRDPAAIRNVERVIGMHTQEPLVIVISAMGKTTDAMEKVVATYTDQGFEAALHEIEALEAMHLRVVEELGLGTDASSHIKGLLGQLTGFLYSNTSKEYDFVYDQVVCYGELMSTRIVCAHLRKVGLDATWLDIRTGLKTDDTYREGKVDWETSGELLRASITGTLTVTQGFIGSTPSGHSTTLGREGSDFTGALLAYVLSAKDLTIWKDVPGVLNADPRWFDETELLPAVSYQDAIELAYYGATVIHPKTIKPLENQSIPLRVKSFLKPEEAGTIISHQQYERLIPCFIFKMDQVFISISARDYSFIVEECLSIIFKAFAKHRVKINVMQNSAISFCVSVDQDQRKVPAVIKELRDLFNVDFQQGELELITIRYYDQATIDRVLVGKTVLLQQKSANTIQLLVKDGSSEPPSLT